MRLVALEQGRDPGSFESLQECIDSANDHNQTMLDAMMYAEPAMYLFCKDHGFDEDTYPVLNWCFDQASVYVEALKDLGSD